MGLGGPGRPAVGLRPGYFHLYQVWPLQGRPVLRFVLATDGPVSQAEGTRQASAAEQRFEPGLPTLSLVL